MKRHAETWLVTTSALLWIVMVVLASLGHWLVALYVLLGLLVVYGLLGSLHEGRFDLRLLAFPTVVWILLWAAAFGLGDYYAEAFAGRPPDFTILGFHPSFAAIVAFFWVVPTLLMGFGFEAVKDRWLSRQRWDEFVRRIDELSGKEGEGDEQA